MATKRVKTNRLEVTHPGDTRVITWGQGSVNAVASFAVTELQRWLRRTKAIGPNEYLPDTEGDKLEAELRKHKKAEMRGYKFTIVPEVEEYELDPGEDENDTDE